MAENILGRLLGGGKKDEDGVPTAPRGEAANPANPPARGVTGRTRIPLSVPRLKLDTPKIPGYVCQWFADRPGRVRQAQEGDYEFVSPEEISLNPTGIAEDPLQTGNTDMGSRVSLYGGVGENGQAERLYLMKLKEEWYLEDQKVIADRNESVAEAIRGGSIDAQVNPHRAVEDAGLQYGGMTGRTGPRRRPAPNLFTPNKRRG